MSGETLLIILLVGLVAGWLAGQIVRGTGFGLSADIAIGIVGAPDWQLVIASSGYSPRNWHCPSNHRGHDRRHYPASNFEAGLSSWPLVIPQKVDTGLAG
jgi:hypothetical protein